MKHIGRWLIMTVLEHNTDISTAHYKAMAYAAYRIREISAESPARTLEDIAREFDRRAAIIKPPRSRDD